MAETIKLLLDALKLGPTTFAVIAISSGFALLGPAQFLDVIGIAKLAQDHRPWLGGAFLLSTAGLLVEAFKWIRRLLRRNQFKREVRKRLERLTEDEKQILRFYVAQETRTNLLSIDDGVVNGLVAEGIISLASRISTVGQSPTVFAFNITDAAWDVLKEDHRPLMGTTNIARTDKQQRRGW